MLVLLPLAFSLAAVGVIFLSLWLTLRLGGLGSPTPPRALRAVRVRPLGPDDDPDFLRELRRRIDSGDVHL